jgi:hypothetical protein
LRIGRGTSASFDAGIQESQRSVCICRFTAPHKLALGHIYEGLEVGDDESVAVRCRRLVAAVITQSFLYMVRAGLQYGEIDTGEATIFLLIPDDPSTVYYSLSVPKGDVCLLADWSERDNQP